MKTREFSVAQNEEIYLLCKSVINFILTEIKTVSKISTDPNARDTIVANLKKGSDIDLLIKNNKWENLFADNNWLHILSYAQSINSIENIITKQLISIANYFPKETEKCIPPFSAPGISRRLLI